MTTLLDDRPVARSRPNPRQSAVPADAVQGPSSTTIGQASAYPVSVRALCAFAAKSGDLDLRFTPSPSALEGIAGHRNVAARRAASHQSEVSLTLAYGGLLVRGRADGYDPQRGCVEEVKTFRGDLSRMPANRRALHWAQAKVYAWMLCRRDNLPAIDVALVYYDIDRDEQLPALVEPHDAAALRDFFERLCDAFVQWADDERAHRARRDDWLRALRFPHATFRDGQHALAGAVWRAVRHERCLMAEAPTGIGKTVGTLYPAMKAMPASRVDRVFFLTARGTGRALALDAVETIRVANEDSQAATTQAFRVIDLTSRDKACEHPDKSCHGDSCPLARGFYDRLPAARIAARDRSVLTHDALRAVALEHAVCPYHLGIEMARWCDLVVGDYNHWFDDHALLFALADEYAWTTVLLVDEAHNLLERARAMYSARLDSRTLVEVGRVLDEDPGPATALVAKSLARLVRAWKRSVSDAADDYNVLAAMPPSLSKALEDVTAAISTHLLDGPRPAHPAVTTFHFDALRLLKLADATGDHSIVDIVVDREASRQRRSSSIGVRNLIPAPYLQPRFAAARAAVLFSATLTPHAFHADTLGLPDDTARVDIPAPFAPDQLTVRIVRDISTRYHDRQRSLVPIADLVANRHAERPGNYLVFVSSHDYLQQLASTFTRRHPTIATWKQARRMSDADRAMFLGRFADGGCGVGFAVLGGVFAEGIDLPGDRLVGAFVATLGLPRFDAVHEAQRKRLDAHYGAGYEYAYLYPGLRKVVQAAGRVIRSVSDRGSLHLIDDRFARPEVLALLPAWWHVAERVSTIRS
jgi:Rad3-related DNA helicase